MNKSTNLKLNCPMLDIKLHFTKFNLNVVVDKSSYFRVKLKRIKFGL